MNTSKISPYQLKRFVRHLCLLASHHDKKERAKKQVDYNLKKLKGPRKNIEDLSKKIDEMLYHEMMLARMGKSRHMSPQAMQEMHILKKEFQLLREERDELMAENEELRKSVMVMPEKVVRKEKKEAKSEVEEIKDKIRLLESQYQLLSKDKEGSMGRLYNIKSKINLFKTKLKGLSA